MCLFKFTTYVGFHSVNLRMRWMYSIYLKKYAGGRPLCTYVNIYINMISWYVFHFSGSDIMKNHCRCHWFMNIWHFKHLKFKPLSTRHPQVRNLHVAADWGHRPFNHLDGAENAVPMWFELLSFSEKNTFTSTNYQKLLWIPKTMVISCNFERCCVFFK